MSWWWRTKPRSIIRTVQWFSEFSKLEGKNWNEEILSPSNKKTHPVRRMYIYNAHYEDDEHINKLKLETFLTGNYDKPGKDAESNGRNDKTTYEFFGFGYVDDNGRIRSTKVGNRITEKTFDSEDFLKQLLKLQFPNPISPLKKSSTEDFIFPFQLLCIAINDFEYVNRSELVLLFGCNNLNQYDKIKRGILSFRKSYNQLPNKNKNIEVINLCKDVFISLYGSLDNEIQTYYEYAEALTRCLLYTGLFKVTGRSIATKLRISEHSISKFKLILNNYDFERKNFSNIEDYMEWYGSANSTELPWNSIEARKDIVFEKIKYIKENRNYFSSDSSVNKKLEKELIDATLTINQTNVDFSKLKDQENKLISLITNAKEKEFIEITSKTKETRHAILEMFDDILDQIDMSALWLEVNTWKSLVALNGSKEIIRNFKIEEDLTPKSFAPGIGNTPDMEMYLDDYIVIPEVSLMTGVRQWEHEASSVIDHVLSFMSDSERKKVFGLFLSSGINIRTQWQFFILNKESWMGKPVPVIPLTIKQYKKIIGEFYEKNLEVKFFAKLLSELHNIALNSTNYSDWLLKTELHINNPAKWFK